jgi:hypothetical protein
MYGFGLRMYGLRSEVLGLVHLGMYFFTKKRKEANGITTERLQL